MKRDPMDAIDLQQLGDVTGNDDAQLDELGRLFLETSQGHLSSIETALSSKNAEQARRVAHAAAGGSAMMGFRGLAESLRAVENALDQNNFAGAQISFSEATKQFNVITQFLKSYRFNKEKKHV
jgi:HPt (histidine-containing phosphotransfer) domain-containing protein